MERALAFCPGGGGMASSRFWAGLDVGGASTSICVIDQSGAIVQESACPSELPAVDREIRWLRRRRSARVGIEAGTGASLARGLRTLGYTVDIFETRQLSKFLRVRRNKTDAGDAAGIAEAGRLGASAVSRVFLKSLDAQALQAELTIRRQLIRQRVATVNLLGRMVDLFGGRSIGRAQSNGFRINAAKKLNALFERSHPLAKELRYLLSLCEQLADHQREIDHELSNRASEDEICRRLMSVPGVGPICALSFKSVIADPHRFVHSSEIGSYLGLAPRLFQSGQSTRTGGISKMGNRAMRALLVQSAMVFMRSAPEDCALRQWATQLEQRRGRRIARVALARKLAIILLVSWKTNNSYCAGAQAGYMAASRPDPDRPTV